MDRVIKILLVLIAIPLWGIWLSRPAVSQSERLKSVEAEKFKLVDSTGKLRGAMMMLGNQPSLVLADEKGKMRTLMSLSEKGSTLEFITATGEPQLRISSSKDETGFDCLYPNGKLALGLGMVKGAPALGLFDDTAKTRAAFAFQPESGSGLSLFGPDEQNRASLTLLKSGFGSIQLKDPKGVTTFERP